MQGGTRELQKIFFKNIPIPNITVDNQNMVTQLEDLTNQASIIDPADKIRDDTLGQIQIQIDQLVYQLYGLNDDEIIIIEQSLNI